MKKIFIVILLATLVVNSGLASVAFAKSKTPNVESSSDPEVKRGPAPQAAPPTTSAAPTLLPAAPAQPVQQTLGPNLISNPSLESASTSPSLPDGWTEDRWSNNNGSFTYPVSGFNGGKAAQVSITSYTSGDAKWYFTDVPVTPGATYQFSNYSQSNVPTEIDARYKMSNGSFTYAYLASINPSPSLTQNTLQITIPQNVVSVTVFHLLQQAGSLTVDEYSLNQVDSTTPPPPPPPPPSGNLVTNPDFETAGTNGSPAGWNKDRWSNNAGVFNYPVTGSGGGKAAQVTITNYTSGDAKWYFDPVTVTPNATYTYSDQYVSNQPTELTAQFQNTDGSFTYKWFGTVQPSSGGFSTVTVDVPVPANAQKVTMFHLIRSVGSLTIDNVSLIPKSTLPNGIFKTGAVSLTFDDGWLSQYQNVVPKLNGAGMKATFYIVSQQLADNGFADFMSKAQVVGLANSGFQIGAHTRTHPHLTTLSAADQQAEIQGSLQDLIGMGISTVTTFAYPFGEYDNSTMQIVKNTGFAAARSTFDGNVVQSSDRYQLPRQSVEAGVPVSQIKQWIDNAVAQKQWLILTFHRIDTSGEQYSATPNTFNQVVDYLVQKKTPVITVAQGVKELP